MAGILFQWYFPLPAGIIAVSLSGSSLLFFIFYFFPVYLRFKFRFVQAVLLQFIIAFAAMLITWQKDCRHSDGWYGNAYKSGDQLLIRIEEPPVRKSKSFKATCHVKAILRNGNIIPAGGRILAYFSDGHTIQYGDLILIRTAVREIKNAGNPGSFDYKRYARFQQVFHHIFIRTGEWVHLKQQEPDRLKQFVFDLQSYTVNTLRKFTSQDKKVLGIAEALLIGYKEDLDKDLVQAYSNTGVVHIIAISGLHLGLIYVVLLWVFNRLPLIRRSGFLKALMIIGSLWLFALLTGASASVLRSAVMFTCIVTGKAFERKSSISNSLAVSAFILLCYNPYFLWDVGFQLSYLAIMGIVWLQQPVFRSFYCKNSIVKRVWEMLSVTIAAQVLTFPVCIYYFHQFPNLFFASNLVAVPLSTVILFAELFLIGISWMPAVANVVGYATGKAIYAMNAIIQYFNDLPFSLTDHIYANIYTTWLLYGAVCCFAGWLLIRHKIYFRLTLLFMLIFTAFHTGAGLQVAYQKKIIVYNIPSHQAIDFVYRRQYFFYGDSILMKEGSSKNFHLKPARIAMQLTSSVRHIPALQHRQELWQFFQKRILIIDRAVVFEPGKEKLKTDILLISKNPPVDIFMLARAVDPAIVVLDASNSLWKIAKWKKQCEALLLPCFSIPDEGAFVYNIE